MMSWQHSTKMEGAPIDEAPASGQEPVGAPHEENPPHNDDNPVTKLFKDMGTKVKNVVAAVERMEEEVMDDKTVNDKVKAIQHTRNCLLYTSPSPRDRQKTRMPSSA